MLLKKIVLRNDDQFSNAIDAWAAQQKISVESFDGK